MYAPLVLVPTRHDLRLLARTSDDYMLLAPEAYDVLKRAVHEHRPLPASILVRAQKMWGLDLSAMNATRALLIRERTEYDYANASWELNLRCNYNCAHCYLGARPLGSLQMPGRLKVLAAMRDLGVYRLQLTGGEPMIDRYFVETYLAAYRMGMLIRISTNASLLRRDKILRLLTDYPPLSVAVSCYGATADTYEGLTRTGSGTFERYRRGLKAAVEAGIKLRLNIIVTKYNDHQVAAMEALADRLGIEHYVYGRLSATVQGTGEVLAAQSSKVDLRQARAPFTGCNAGKTFFHVDPSGRASICKIAREPWVQLNKTGAAGIGQLVAASAELMSRSGACAGCELVSSCSTCPPQVDDYRKAGASEAFYCQHSSREGDTLG